MSIEDLGTVTHWGQAPGRLRKATEGPVRGRGGPWVTCAPRSPPVTLELAIRELEYFGLADYQCYLAMAIHRFVHLACLAFCLYRLVQLDKESRDWLPPAPKGVSPARFAYLRQRLQRYVLGRILSSRSGEIPNLEDSQSGLEAILRIVA